jgi:hypothetical protein
LGFHLFGTGHVPELWKYQIGGVFDSIINEMNGCRDILSMPVTSPV